MDYSERRFENPVLVYVTPVSIVRLQKQNDFFGEKYLVEQQGLRLSEMGIAQGHSCFTCMASGMCYGVCL